MNCNEPACPYPANREGFCQRHWLLRYGTAEDLLATESTQCCTKRTPRGRTVESAKRATLAREMIRNGAGRKQ